jgi:hypothetical protein
MDDTPRWALHLVMALQQWEDEGHQLTRESNMAEVRAACHEDWLQLVPEEVRVAARAIRDYVGTPVPVPPAEHAAG